MSRLLFKDTFGRPAGAATALAVDLLRSDSFQAAGMNRRSDLVFRAAYIASRFYTVGWLAVAVAIFDLHQPAWAATRP